MSLTIIGGNECMERKYEEICRGYGHKVKIFTKASGMIKKKIGSPDLVIMFTNTVSHKMVKFCIKRGKKKRHTGTVFKEQQRLCIDCPAGIL